MSATKILWGQILTVFLIVLMTLSDVIAGFTVTISTARRDMQRS